MAPSDDGWPSEELRQFVAVLNETEREVLRLRAGFDRGEPRTLEEVAEALGLSLDEVRAIEGRALEQLKALLRPGD